MWFAVKQEDEVRSCTLLHPAWSPRLSRPLRITSPGAIYHVTSRGDRREPIFVDNGDRHALLAVLAETMNRCNAAVLAYSMMGKHGHFVLHTHRAKLSRLLRLLRHLNLKTAATPVP